MPSQIGDARSASDAMRREGISMARTAEGFELPVLDVTHPRFALPEDAASLATLHEDLLRRERRNARMPRFLMRLLLKSAAKRSRLVKAMFGTDATYLDGLSTYVMKLGPMNLAPPFDTPMDRNFAAAPHVTYMRLRTQQVAGLLADRLAPVLGAAGRRPLHLINIAGGPAIDSLNALILLARRSPDLLARPIAVHVLDLDAAGPAFGANALAALKQAGGPLQGLDIDLTHQSYDWNQPAPLAALVEALAGEGAIMAASSEGGLFEYGDDEAIVANLRVLHANGHGVLCVGGSVTRNDEFRRGLIGANRFRIVPRGLEGFAPLAARAGFSVVDVRPGALSDQVLCIPA